MEHAKAVWEKVLAVIEKKMTKTTVDTWFDDTEAVDFTQSALILYSPYEYKREIIKLHYIEHIQSALYDLFSVPFSVTVLDTDERERYLNRETGPAASNHEFTFENFVVGSSNKFAHAAAKAVADNPAGAYNPLFIYGESGLGKTHLLYAISNVIRNRKPGYKIVYIKGDDFTNELIAAIQSGKNIEFRQKYRNADLFLVDDIQFIAGKDSTQEEFFHTFNTLYEAKKQIVLTSDRPPKEMIRLEDRLKTRFEWGLLADIQPPDYETRMAIIKNKANSLNLNLPDAVADYIAENITNNVRQIEGTVKKILAYRDLEHGTIDVSSVSRAIKDMFKSSEEKTPTPELIMEEVCKFYSIDETALRGQRRTKDTVNARHIAMYIIRKMTNLSLPEIGKLFNGRDHTTVMHSITKIENQEKLNAATADSIRDLISNINSRL